MAGSEVAEGERAGARRCPLRQPASQPRAARPRRAAAAGARRQEARARAHQPTGAGLPGADGENCSTRPLFTLRAGHVRRRGARVARRGGASARRRAWAWRLRRRARTAVLGRSVRAQGEAAIAVPSPVRQAGRPARGHPEHARAWRPEARRTSAAMRRARPPLAGRRSPAAKRAHPFSKYMTCSETTVPRVAPSADGRSGRRMSMSASR